MTPQTIIDTGPLVAAINRRDQFHSWSSDAWKKVSSPLLTCEAVIAEACFLLHKVHAGQDVILSMLDQNVIQIAFSLDAETGAIQTLMRQYQSVPMSLADACLVRMSELLPDSVVLTLDSDFRIYRQHRNQIIPVMMPDSK